MARDLESIVKRSRREGYALHPKAHKALVKRTTPPGQKTGGYGGRRSKPSQYSLQLREKQKVKRLYGLLERQFAKLMQEATQTNGHYVFFNTRYSGEFMADSLNPEACDCGTGNRRQQNPS